MRLTLREALPFITVRVMFQGQTLDIPEVLLDTGSASTLLSADWVRRIGLRPEALDELHTIRGVGGSEVVFARVVDQLAVEGHALRQFEIEVGGLQYGFGINGILGMDFLIQSGALINLNTLTLTFAP